MADIILGLLAVLAGGVMLFAGRLVLRIVLPIWGFFAGFTFGAGLVAEFADERFLGTVLGWVLGLIFAVIFGVLSGHRAIVILGSVFCTGCVLGLLQSSRSSQPSPSSRGL